MFGSSAISELPLGTLTIDEVGGAPTARGNATVVGTASGRGVIALILRSAPGHASAISQATARLRAELEVARAPTLSIATLAAAQGRLEIGNVVAKITTTPLPLTTVATEVMGLVSHHSAPALEDASITTSVLPTFIETATEVLGDLHVTVGVLDD